MKKKHQNSSRLIIDEKKSPFYTSTRSMTPLKMRNICYVSYYEIVFHEIHYYVCMHTSLNMMTHTLQPPMSTHQWGNTHTAHEQGHRCTPRVGGARASIKDAQCIWRTSCGHAWWRPSPRCAVGEASALPSRCIASCSLSWICSMRICLGRHPQQEHKEQANA